MDAATSLQTPTGGNPESDWEQGYGYLFWRFRHGCYGGAGLLGQFCIVMPQFDAVLSITAGSWSGPSVLDLVWDRIVPAFSHSPLPSNLESNHGLTQKLMSLTLKMPAGETTSPTAAKIAGRRYVFAENPQRIESVEFGPQGEGANATIRVKIAGKEQRLVCGKGTWLKGTLEADCGGLVPMTGYLGADFGEPIPIAVSGAWSSGDTYTVTLCRYRTAFSSTYDMRVSGNELILERDHAGAESTSWARLIGTA